MIRLFVFCWLLAALPAIAGIHKWLKKMDAYHRPSYFREEVYKELDIHAFYQLDEIHQEIIADSVDLHLLNACLFYAGNRLRTMNKIPPCLMDKRLQDAAAVHSWQMSELHFFGHNNPYCSSIRTPEDRLKACGIQYKTEGENCLRNLLTGDDYTYIGLAQAVIESLYNSPPHRSNLLNSTFRYGACGSAIENYKGDIYLLVTQDFYNN